MRSSVLYSRRQMIRLSGAAALGGLLVVGANMLPRVAAAQDASDFSPGDAVIVNTDALNLRSGPGLDDDVVTEMWYGTAGTIEDGPVAADGYTWYQLNIGVDGWAAGEYLQLQDDGEAGGQRIQVVDGPLNIRTDASLSGDVITTVPTGTTLIVLQADGGTWADGYHWIYIRVEGEGTRGFIADAFTAPVSD